MIAVVTALKVWQNSQLFLMFHKLLNLPKFPGLQEAGCRGQWLDAASQKLLQQLGRARRARRERGKRGAMQRIHRQERLLRHEERGQELPGTHGGHDNWQKYNTDLFRPVLVSSLISTPASAACPASLTTGATSTTSSTMSTGSRSRSRSLTLSSCRDTSGKWSITDRLEKVYRMSINLTRISFIQSFECLIYIYYKSLHKV